MSNLKLLLLVTAGNQCQMLLFAEGNQSASAQMNSEGHTKLIEAESQIHSKNKESSGNAVTFYNEKGEVENGLMLSDYHIFVNENNEVRVDNAKN